MMQIKIGYEQFNWLSMMDNANDFLNEMIEESMFLYSQKQSPPVKYLPSIANRYDFRCYLNSQVISDLDFWARKYFVRKSEILRGLIVKAYEESVIQKTE